MDRVTAHRTDRQGAAYMLAGTSVAALIAFSIARRTGGGLDLFQKEGGGDDAAWRKVIPIENLLCRCSAFMLVPGTITKQRQRVLCFA